MGPRLLAAGMLWLAGCNCGDDPAAEPASGSTGFAAPVEAVPPVVDDGPPRGTLAVQHGRALSQRVLDDVTGLDLAFALDDRLGQLDELDATDVCTSVDLPEVLARAPKLRSLRISGCANLAAALAGATQIEQLTLAELELDPSIVAALATLSGLRRLELVRVTTPEKLELEPLEALALREVTMLELTRGTVLERALDLWPRTLTRARLVGRWAGHDAMLSLSKVESLEVLELDDTRIGNFSLNQIKPLSRLREISWAGDTFNDNSPLYFRELPVVKFSCDCPRFGDGGLHTLRHCESVEVLELLRSSVSGPGLAALARLPALKQLKLVDRDIGTAGLDALQQVPTLRWLELSGDFADGRMEHLGSLVWLERLRLHAPAVDDHAAAEIGNLHALRELDLAGTQISDVGLAAFAGLTRLETLVLSQTRVTNRGLAHLATLGNLRHLMLDHTDVVDAGAVHLGQLVTLESLRLDHTLVTDAAIEPLLKLVQLRRLDVSATVVTPAGAARLASLPKLTELILAPESEPPQAR
ncbi:MAG: hypothetical protein IPK74_10815 [Deltaproteobacteria bacterium]|nr:hypothetical protein [Deltaproteobacteria bacterium]